MDTETGLPKNIEDKLKDMAINSYLEGGKSSIENFAKAFTLMASIRSKTEFKLTEILEFVEIHSDKWGKGVEVKLRK